MAESGHQFEYALAQFEIGIRLNVSLGPCKELLATLDSFRSVSHEHAGLRRYMSHQVVTNFLSVSRMECNILSCVPRRSLMMA